MNSAEALQDWLIAHLPEFEAAPALFIPTIVREAERCFAGYTHKKARRGLAEASFDGDTIDPVRDEKRLRGQLAKVFNWWSARVGEWHTDMDCAGALGILHASAQARRHDLVKLKFGAYPFARRSRGNGLYEYQMKPYATATLAETRPA